MTASGKSFVRVAATSAALLLSGCFSTMGALTYSASADRFRDGSGVPENGQRIDASSGAALSHSMVSMMRELPSREEQHFKKAVVGLALHRNCLRTGYYALAPNSGNFAQRTGMFDGRKLSRDECANHRTRFYDAVLWTSGSMERCGRPDCDVERRRTWIVSGESRDYGISPTESWNRFHASGAHAVDGLTRTELYRRYAEVWDAMR